ncbi:MAG: gephyrin-like molybdotransferase Glp [Pseudomonadota bacterium]
MLVPVDEAVSRVLKAARLNKAISLPLHDADGYRLAEDVAATRTQPPFAASAMDGYAVRRADLDEGTVLKVIGEAAAGHSFSQSLGTREAVRIFTGAPLPDGADTILIQEDAETSGQNEIIPKSLPKHGDYVRPAGMDFAENETLLKKGTRLNFQSLSLAAAMNLPNLPVFEKPRVGIVSNGDELVVPGGSPGPDQIISSNAFGVASLIRENGGVAIDYGIAPDRPEAIRASFEGARKDGSDVIVTLGGASVGDHDLVRPVLLDMGAELDFWKIAMRPGKPFMFGLLDGVLILGMPGNPVSSLVCSILFLKPLLLAMQGDDPTFKVFKAALTRPLPKNSHRQGYLRATVDFSGKGYQASPFDQQDSSILTVLAQANALVIRPPNAVAAAAGEECEFVWL